MIEPPTVETLDEFPTPVVTADEARSNPVSDLFTGPKVRGKRRGEPPKKAAPKARKPAPPKRKGSLRQPLEDLYAMIGVLLTPIDPVCGKAIVNAAPKCAETLDELAYQNEAVRRVLTSLVTTSTFGAVVAAHVPIALAIAVHHIPAVKETVGKFGQDIAEKVQAASNDAPTPNTDVA